MNKKLIAVAALTVTQITVGMLGAARVHAAPPAKPVQAVLTAAYDTGPPPGQACAGKCVPSRIRAMNWAVTQHGCSYHYGAVGPCGNGYDCSGLVYAAYRAIGIRLPRDTYEMLANAHSAHPILIRTYHPERGDLAFFGSGHVELVTRLRHVTFGAEQPGTKVGWHHWNAYWHPDAFYRVR